MEKKRKAGRPKVNAANQFIHRHVVNVTPEMHEGFKAWQEKHQMPRITDAVRAAAAAGLRAGGFIK